ncbi:hypothetical protein V8E55_004391 [Tylopilus felleus]
MDRKFFSHSRARSNVKTSELHVGDSTSNVQVAQLVVVRLVQISTCPLCSFASYGALTCSYLHDVLVLGSSVVCGINAFFWNFG